MRWWWLPAIVHAITDCDDEQQVCMVDKDAAIIWLHGLGDSGSGWMHLRREFATEFSYVDWTFPNAPSQPVSVNGGMQMPSWFDIYDIPVTLSSVADDEKGLLESVEKIHQIAREKEAQGIPSERILFGGFSQGAVVSYLAGLSYPKPIGGIIAFSGWLPLPENIPVQQQNRALPILICHGERDNVVSFELGQKAHSTLKSKANTEFHSYPTMGHSSCDQELIHLREWLQVVLNSAN